MGQLEKSLNNKKITKNIEGKKMLENSFKKSKITYIVILITDKIRVFY